MALLVKATYTFCMREQCAWIFYSQYSWASKATLFQNKLHAAIAEEYMASLDPATSEERKWDWAATLLDNSLFVCAMCQYLCEVAFSLLFDPTQCPGFKGTSIAFWWFFPESTEPPSTSKELQLLSHYQFSPQHFIHLLEWYIKLFSTAACPEKDYSQALVSVVQRHLACFTTPLPTTEVVHNIFHWLADQARIIPSNAFSRWGSYLQEMFCFHPTAFKYEIVLDDLPKKD